MPSNHLLGIPFAILNGFRRLGYQNTYPTCWNPMHIGEGNITCCMCKDVDFAKNI